MFQAEDGIRESPESRGLRDVYEGQLLVLHWLLLALPGSVVQVALDHIPSTGSTLTTTAATLITTGDALAITGAPRF